LKTQNTILAVNSGSSSLKFALYSFDSDVETLLLRGLADRIGGPDAHLHMTVPSNHLVFDYPDAFADHSAALHKVIGEIENRQYPAPAAVAHRVVNGGPDHLEPQFVTDELLAQMQRLIPLAPLHLPTELKIIDSVHSQLPGTPQIVCYDTAFHRVMPRVAQQFPLPRKFWEEGVRRYGFHGLSYQYIVEKLGASANGRRVIIAHLGNGSSLAAVRDGQSVDTTMGFTPTGGVMMGTRSGDLDPGVLLYLLREKQYDVATLERLVDRESGLLGVSAISSDMKVLLQQATTDEQAREAVDMFCYIVRKHIGALAAVLGGCDTLVFTGGIGEHAPPIRENICGGLSYLGVTVDAAKNTNNEQTISGSGGSCLVQVIATNEELMIARHAYRLIKQEKSS
jgi:acetate kinase